MFTTSNKKHSYHSIKFSGVIPDTDVDGTEVDSVENEALQQEQLGNKESTNICPGNHSKRSYNAKSRTGHR